MKHLIWIIYEKIKHVVREKTFYTFGTGGGLTIGAFLFGSIGSNFIVEYIVKLIVSLISAFLCGIAGVLGKDYMEKRKLKRNASQKTKKKKNGNSDQKAA